MEKISKESFLPAYYYLFQQDKFKNIKEKLWEHYSECQLCPRVCGINRLKGEKGFCQAGIKPKIARAIPHLGEEPPLSGTYGAGTIFFSHCTLKCIYCQNYQISQEFMGKEVEIPELAEIMLALSKQGCHNISLVSATHFLPSIISALEIAYNKGLILPLILNSGGYENPRVINLLKDIIDIYLPDMKYADEELAFQLSGVRNYTEYNQAALYEMYLQRRSSFYNSNGILQKGMIIRHLVLPGQLENTKKILTYLVQHFPGVPVSIMGQYFPTYKAIKFNYLNRFITEEEYSEIEKIAKNLGLNHFWRQDITKLEQQSFPDFADNNIKVMQ